MCATVFVSSMKILVYTFAGFVCDALSMFANRIRCNLIWKKPGCTQRSDLFTLLSKEQYSNTCFTRQPKVYSETSLSTK